MRATSSVVVLSSLLNAAIVLARHLTTTPAFQQIIGDRNLTLVVSTDFQGLRPTPADEAEITALVDQSLVGSTSASPATTNASNANVPNNPPVTTAPPSGIIGLAPSGVACS